MNKNENLPPAENDLPDSLKNSHTILQGVMESPKDAVIFALDRRYRYIAYNRNHHQTMQRIWGADIELGKSMLTYIGDPDDRLKAQRNFDRALSGESFTMVETYGDVSPERRHYENIYNPIIDENGETIGLTLFLADVTEQRQAEDRLQQCSALEQITSGILSDLVRSDDGSIDAAINRALEKIGEAAGADRAYIFRFREGLSRIDNTHEWCADGIEPQIDNLKDITLDDELPWFAEHIRNLKTFHIPEVAALPPEALLEHQHFESQGIQSLIVVPMETGDALKGFLGFDAVRTPRTWAETDITILRFIGEAICVATERNRAVEALRESEARWQFALEGAGDGVWDMNIAANQVYYSPRWKRMLGYNEKDIGDTMDVWKELLHPDDREAVHTEIVRHTHGETPIFQSEHRLRCKDGAYKWILARGKITAWTEEGNPLRVIGTHTDISKSKQLETQREQLIAELKTALSQVKQLSGLLPICSYCKKIRDDKGYWKQIESYIRDHSQVEFSHSICQECAKKHYPDLYHGDD